MEERKSCYRWRQYQLVGVITLWTRELHLRSRITQTTVLQNNYMMRQSRQGLSKSSLQKEPPKLKLIETLSLADGPSQHCSKEDLQVTITNLRVAKQWFHQWFASGKGTPVFGGICHHWGGIVTSCTPTLHYSSYHSKAWKSPWAHAVARQLASTPQNIKSEDDDGAEESELGDNDGSEDFDPDDEEVEDVELEAGDEQVEEIKKKKPSKPKEKYAAPQGHYRNEEIAAKHVRLVFDEGHKIVSREEALSLAKKQNLDLVQVDSKADPPVCKIFDFHREEYKKEQHQKDQRKKKGDAVRLNDIKELRFTSKTELKDLKMKVEKAKQFMDRGHRVKFVAVYKADSGQGELLDKIFPLVEEVAVIEQGPRVESRQAWVMFRHVKFGKIKKKPPKPQSQTIMAEQMEDKKVEEEGHESDQSISADNEEEENVNPSETLELLWDKPLQTDRQNFPTRKEEKSTGTPNRFLYHYKETSVPSPQGVLGFRPEKSPEGLAPHRMERFSQPLPLQGYQGYPPQHLQGSPRNPQPPQSSQGVQSPEMYRLPPQGSQLQNPQIYPPPPAGRGFSPQNQQMYPPRPPVAPAFPHFPQRYPGPQQGHLFQGPGRPPPPQEGSPSEHSQGRYSPPLQAPELFPQGPLRYATPQKGPPCEQVQGKSPSPFQVPEGFSPQGPQTYPSQSRPPSQHAQGRYPSPLQGPGVLPPLGSQRHPVEPPGLEYPPNLDPQRFSASQGPRESFNQRLSPQGPQRSQVPIPPQEPQGSQLRTPSQAQQGYSRVQVPQNFQQSSRVEAHLGHGPQQAHTQGQLRDMAPEALQRPSPPPFQGSPDAQGQFRYAPSDPRRFPQAPPQNTPWSSPQPPIYSPPVAPQTQPQAGHSQPSSYDGIPGQGFQRYNRPPQEFQEVPQQDLHKYQQGKGPPGYLSPQGYPSPQSGPFPHPQRYPSMQHGSPSPQSAQFPRPQGYPPVQQGPPPPRFVPFPDSQGYSPLPDTDEFSPKKS